jgi:hypothetical protein
MHVAMHAVDCATDFRKLLFVVFIVVIDSHAQPGPLGIPAQTQLLLLL